MGILFIFKIYGTIKNHFYRGKHSVKYFHGRETERMTVIMEINRHIPSALYIKDTACDLLISYAGQPITCHRCGDLNHKIKSCTKQIGTGINVFELDPEPIDKTEHETVINAELPDEDEESEEPINDDEQAEPTDTPIITPQAEPSPSQTDPSPTLESPSEKQETQEETAIQVSNPNKDRPANETTSRQDEAVKVHPPTHTEEKPKPQKDESLKDKPDINATHTGGKPLSSQTVYTKKAEKLAENIPKPHTEGNPCNKCNLTFTHHDDLNQHTQAHLGTIPFKCSDCDYKTNKIETLIKHMSEKNHMMDKVLGMNGMPTRSTFAEKVKTISRGRRK